MPPLLSGPEAQPLSGAPARQLVVLLHGVGADGADLAELIPYLAPALPDAAFVAPDGPEPYDMAPFGRQWFSLADRSAPALADGVRRAAAVVDGFLDQQLARFGLSEAECAVVGFSQGTMTALQVAPRRQRALALVVGFSGALVAADSLAGELRSRPRVLLIHGDADEVVNPACLGQAERDLSALGIPVLAESRPGVGHSIDGPGLALAIGVLRQAFGLEEDG